MQMSPNHPHKNAKSRKTLPEPHDMEIQMKQVQESEGTRLLRHRSDMRFCNVLSSGILCLLAADIICAGLAAHAGERIAAVVTFVLVTLRGWRIEEFYTDATVNAWLLRFVVRPSLNGRLQQKSGGRDGW